LTHVGSLALRAHSYARCGSGGWEVLSIGV
jgi:hypothetical protein